jgi:exoribonuclease R
MCEPTTYAPTTYAPTTYAPTTFALSIGNRNYTEYEFINTHNSQKDIHSIKSNPLEQKLFHKDIIDKDGKLLRSPYRENETIPGVLILAGNTYGHVNGNLKGKLLYKCLPDAKHLPAFLIPYEDKTPTFTKQKVNKYITFRIKEWVSKHPVGILTHTLGNVDDTESFYQYQIYCKGLQHSLSALNKATTTATTTAAQKQLIYEIGLKSAAEDRRLMEVFSIDPVGSKDIDDALGITTTKTGQIILSIYIANVALVLDYLNLWSHLSKRVSTIYLPTGKIPMLATVLSEDLCSLLAKVDRVAYCMEITLDGAYNLETIDFKRVLINVRANYVYEEANLLAQPAYQRILHITQHLNKHYRFVGSVDDSHQVVEFYMIFMNFESSKKLLERKNGIFRITTEINSEEALMPVHVPVSVSLPSEFSTFLNAFNNQHIRGSYCAFDPRAGHALIGPGLPSYTHITSPIRRLVDLLNLIIMQPEYLTETALQFAQTWCANIAGINTDMKNIKKVQTTCDLFALYLKDGPKQYSGLVFNRTECRADFYKFSVYIPALKMVTTLKTGEKLQNYTVVKVSTHVFYTEDNIKKKIRVQLI